MRLIVRHTVALICLWCLSWPSFASAGWVSEPGVRATAVVARTESDWWAIGVTQSNLPWPLIHRTGPGVWVSVPNGGGRWVSTWPNGTVVDVTSGTGLGVKIVDAIHPSNVTSQATWDPLQQLATNGSDFWGISSYRYSGGANILVKPTPDRTHWAECNGSNCAPPPVDPLQIAYSFGTGALFMVGVNCDIYRAIYGSSWDFASPNFFCASAVAPPPNSLDLASGAWVLGYADIDGKGDHVVAYTSASAPYVYQTAGANAHIITTTPAGRPIILDADGNMSYWSGTLP